MSVKKLRRFVSRLALGGLVASLLTAVAPLPAQATYTSSTSGTQTTLTFSYTGTLETFTVPANVTEVTITVTGAEGGRGGSDYSIRPLEAGYKGVVTGTIPVTPGRILTVAVGARGADPLNVGCYAGLSNSNLDPNRAIGGTNPLGEYNGGDGGSPGASGCSGLGGSGGAASVVKIGTALSASADALIVAGGSGGSGGNGQYAALQGGLPQATFAARATASTNGETGLNVYTVCSVASSGCDGGGGAAGGGGAVGGKRGEVPFGTGTNTEWYGLGAYPGQNSTSGLAGLSASYNYFTYSGVSNKRNGSVTISYSNGVPSSPSGVNGNAVTSGVDLYWTAPTTPGAAAIDSYQVEYSVSPFSSWTTAAMCTGTATTCSVTGLTNGTAYKFRVAAHNSIGLGGYSALSQELTPSGPPAAPTMGAVTAGDGSLSVAFTAGASTAPISDYEYSLDGGTTWFSAGATSSPLTISGLTNGTSYSVLIRAVNSAGVGSASTAGTGTPSALPGAPTILSLVDGGSGTSLVVSFAAGYAGGSTILDYEYATSVGENTSAFGSYVSVGSTASPFTISGLTSGTAYTVKLRAKNSAGYGPDGAFQTGVTLAAPSAPVITGITSGDGRLTVTYTGYDSTTNGGSAISKLEYSKNGGTTWVDAGTLATTFTILGLTNGTSYSVKLRATNAIGLSSASVAVSGIPASVPDSPRNVSVIAGQTKATVAWLAPLDNGGAAVTGYTATAWSALTGGAASANCSTALLTCEITGLTNGTTYYVSVVATNAAGSSVATSPRISVTPAAAPGAPTINSVSAGNAYLSVAFTAGTSDVNAPITGYQYSTNGGTTWANASGLTSPIVISSLTNGTTYSVKLRAVSLIGTGASSSAASGTPYTVPSNVDPDTISYTAGSGSVVVSWTAPSANGSAITNSYVTAFSAATGGSSSGTCNTTGSTTSCTISGLSNGTTYYVSIETVNGAGYSQRSTPRVAVRPGTASTTALVSSAASIISGASVTLTATVTTGATGTVNFTSGGSTITGCGSVAISAATATCSTTSLAAGANSVRASYSGNATYASSASSVVSVEVLNQYTITYDKRGGTQAKNSDDYIPGGTDITLPTPTRASYVFDGWFDSAIGGSRIGNGGAHYAPGVSRTVYAHWVQASLWGMGVNTKIGTMTAVNGIGHSITVTGGGTGVALDYQADALPAGTILDVYLLADTSRAASLITATSNFVVSLVVAWKATDDTVPDTASGKPLTMTITNSSIKAGSKIYALLGNTVTELGTATVDGQAVVQLTSDPEVVIATVKPDAPTGVSASAGDARATVSWTAPASNGGSAITGYTVTANTGQTCTTTSLSCVVTGLTNGTAFTFTVVATNANGNSAASSASTAVSPVAASSGGSGGGGSGGGGTGGSPSPTPTPTPTPTPVPTTPPAYQAQLPTLPVIASGPVVLINNTETRITQTITTNNTTLNLNCEAWSLILNTQNPAGQRNGLFDGQLSFSTADDIRFTVKGLKPNSLVEVYLFSNPTYVGQVMTDANGNVNGTLPAPDNLPVGSHTLQLGGYLKDGSVTHVSVKVAIVPAAMSLTGRAYFAPGSAALSAAQQAALRKVASPIKKAADLAIRVSGYVLKTGFTKDDVALAKARAAAVIAYLKKIGVKAKYSVVAAGLATETDWRARRTEAVFTYTK